MANLDLKSKPASPVANLSKESDSNHHQEEDFRLLEFKRRLMAAAFFKRRMWPAHHHHVGANPVVPPGVPVATTAR